MSSEARQSAEVPGSPQDVATRVERALLAERCTITQRFPEALAVNFTTRKTMLSWELEGQIVVSPGAAGSRIDLVLNTHHNRPVALMDGAKNAKSAKKLMEKITASL